VLNSNSKQIRECYQHAGDCAQKAAAQTDTDLRQDFLDLEKSWLTLARSIEATERFDTFSKNALKPNGQPR
jgi:hypothetical protein